MKYKTLFRVMLKLVGVWMGVGAIGSLITHLGMLSYYLGNSTIRASGQQWYFVFNVASPLIQLGLGLYLFFGGKWIADKAIPGNRPYCHECGYDLTNAAGNVCTECGTPFKPAAIAAVVEASSAP